MLVIEGLRRSVGMILTSVVILFFVLALIGHQLPGSLAGMKLEPAYLFYYLAWDPTAMLGTPLIVVTTIVTTFVLFGQVLLKAGGSEFFTELSMLIVGRFRGGQAKIAVTASGLFGSISGSAVSNVATTGVITIPLMRKAGYSATQAGAIEAVASTGGQLMPPIMGAAAFLMAEFLQISYAEVVIVAIVPALLYYAALFIIADLEAARRNIRPAAQDLEMPSWSHVIKTGWYFPIPFAVLIGALFYLNYTPEYSALLGTISIALLSLIFGYKGKRMTPLDLLRALRDTGTAVLDIIMIGAAAGLVIGILSISGLGFALTLALVQLGGGSVIAVLLMAALICILLGMGMPTAGVYILLAALVAPSSDRSRRAADRRAFVYSVFRHDVDDYTAGGDCGVCGRQFIRRRCDENRFYRDAFRLGCVCRAVFICILAIAVITRGCVCDYYRRINGANRGLDRV